MFPTLQNLMNPAEFTGKKCVTLPHRFKATFITAANGNPNCNRRRRRRSEIRNVDNG